MVALVDFMAKILSEVLEKDQLRHSDKEFI
jgi:hypothetical protein